MSGFIFHPRLSDQFLVTLRKYPSHATESNISGSCIGDAICRDVISKREAEIQHVLGFDPMERVDQQNRGVSASYVLISYFTERRNHCSPPVGQ